MIGIGFIVITPLAIWGFFSKNDLSSFPISSEDSNSESVNDTESISDSTDATSPETPPETLSTFFILPVKEGNFIFTSTETTCSITDIKDKTVMEIIVPDNVTSISNSAFYGCSSLKSVTFNGTVEQCKTIEKGWDWNCKVPATEVVCSDGKI